MEFLNPLNTNPSVYKSILELKVAKIKNYVNGINELIQDLLLTVEQYNGLIFNTDIKMINHNKRNKTKPEEIVEMIKCGKIKKNWLIIDRGIKIR